MKKVLFVTILITIICCGCSSIATNDEEIEQKDKVISELLNEIDELKAENGELSSELRQRELELDQRDLEIENLKKSTKILPDDLYLVNVSNGEGLNVRSGPAKDYHVIGTVAGQSYIQVISIENGWAKIRYGDDIGYVMADFISPLASSKGEEYEIS